jgi:hypothetical protein
MDRYQVTTPDGDVVAVDATSAYRAVAKAHKQLTGERATATEVTWHGVYALCKNRRYNKPVIIWSGR